MRNLAFASFIVLAGCVSTTSTDAPKAQAPKQTPKAVKPTEAQVSRFWSVVNSMEPVVERVCRERTQNVNCDFKVVIDDRPSPYPNAFQTVDRTGRPIMGFNQAMIADARNRDEIAFVMGHETAHHIEQHLVEQRNNAIAGAIVLGGLAALTGASSSGVDAASRLGADVGRRSYSKNQELEADALGTVITRRAGFNALRGAEFFNRIPDPGDRFLGTHPPNKERIETVRRVNASLN